ncbi:MAG: SDR family NAD(P)-dependent oxidoreductase [Solirubrobacteraceae bacterium]
MSRRPASPVAIVTGASHGFGELIAQTLARRGYRVFAGMRGLKRRNATAAERLRALAAAEALALDPIELDVTDDASVAAAVERILAKVGRIDVVVNNAGVLFYGVTEGGSATQSYLLVMEAPNVGVAPNGDRVELTCESRGGACGTFQVHPKALPEPPSGEFVHRSADGTVVAAGTWTATQLISFHLYGCRFIPALGVDLGSDDLCGGALKMQVDLATPAGTFPGVLTVFCIVGPKAPASHSTPAGEGVTLLVPGLINFNHVGGGMNVYVRQS